MKEATKTRQLFGELEKRIFCGNGIDIGCGDDPITPDAKRFDTDDGDANLISQYVSDTFHYVFSAHCLEHMACPFAALQEWWKLVETDGYLYVVVPDEDLYEQGVWPSRYNSDHKHTFTLSKAVSWNINSINIIELISILPDAKIIKIAIQDEGYDYTLPKNVDQTLGRAMAQIVFVLQKQTAFENVRYYNFSKKKVYEKIRTRLKRLKAYLAPVKRWLLK